MAENKDLGEVERDGLAGGGAGHQQQHEDQRRYGASQLHGVAPSLLVLALLVLALLVRPLLMLVDARLGSGAGRRAGTAAGHEQADVMAREG